MASTGGAAQDILDRVKEGKLDETEAAKELQQAMKKTADAARNNAKYVDKGSSAFLDYAQQSDFINAEIVDGQLVKARQDKQMAEGTDSSESLTKAVDLITTGLEACLDKAQGGEIAENLAVIYDWANREIMLARLRRDPKMLQGVINAMQPLAEAWREHAGLTNDLVEAANQTMNMASAEVRSVGSAMAA
jgi:flagellar biosynthetic protein FliS